MDVFLNHAKIRLESAAIADDADGDPAGREMPDIWPDIWPSVGRDVACNVSEWPKTQRARGMRRYTGDLTCKANASLCRRRSVLRLYEWLFRLSADSTGLLTIAPDLLDVFPNHAKIRHENAAVADDADNDPAGRETPDIWPAFSPSVGRDVAGNVSEWPKT